MSPTTKTSGWPGRVRSSLTAMRPARSSCAPDCSASWAPSSEACTPAAHTLQTDSIRRWRAVGVLDVDAGGVDADHLGAELDLDADLGEPLGGLGAELVAEGAEHLRGGVEQDDARPAGVDVAEVLRSVRRDSSAIWPAISTPVGPGADDDEGHQPLDLLGGAGQLGPLERRRRCGRAARGRRRSTSCPGRTGRSGRCRSRTGRRRLRRGACRRGSPCRGRGRLEVTVLAARSMWVTLPSRTRAFVGAQGLRGWPARSRPRRGCRSPPGRAAAGTGGGWSWR